MGVRTAANAMFAEGSRRDDKYLNEEQGWFAGGGLTLPSFHFHSGSASQVSPRNLGLEAGASGGSPSVSHVL